VSRISTDNRDWEGVAVLCKSADERSLLMVLQGYSGEEPSWAVPGGSIEPGETLAQAAIREVKEETGLEVRTVHPYAVVEGVKEYGAYRVHYFQADVMGGEAEAGDLDGLIHRVAWVPADRLPDLRFSHEDQRQVLMEFMGVS
jgi:acetyl-CoA carboxylase carboxyl transferase subunit beta